jgi:hypothetical protein|tara:strand:- start:85 stop:351 length:267 start_codon:yes stop_codon:yes gene_type:complete
MIPQRIKDQINDVILYVDDCDDWVTIKKEIMKGIPAALRKNFSTRDSKTKEQWLNDFDKLVINYYKELTGIDLVLRSIEERRKFRDVL